MLISLLHLGLALLIPANVLRETPVQAAMCSGLVGGSETSVVQPGSPPATTEQAEFFIR